MSMIKPRSLQAGDKVGIVATGRKVHLQEVEAAEKLFTSWGLKVAYGSNLFNNDHHYLAATDEQRLNDLQRMLDREEIKAIICARGGYGTSRIVDQLTFATFQRDPKWIVGFSDVTTLHLKLFRLGFETIHATMPILFSKPESASSIESLKLILFGGATAIKAASNQNNKPGKATGQVIGGNLSLIVDSLATSSEPDLDAKILVVEETDEYLYKIDRMFTHLKRAGKLDKIKGLVVGHMTDIKDTTPAFGETVEEIILDKVKQFDYPVAFSFPIGHKNPNLAWRHGSVMTLTVEEQGSVLQYHATAQRSAYFL